jgi:hypothetical protein
MNTGLTRHQVSSRANVRSFGKKLKFESVKRDLAGQIFAVVVTKQHATGTKHSKLNLNFPGSRLNLLVDPLTHLGELLLDGCPILALSFHQIEVERANVCFDKISRTGPFDFGHAFEVCVVEVLACQFTVHVENRRCDRKTLLVQINFCKLSERIVKQDLIRARSDHKQI